MLSIYIFARRDRFTRWNIFFGMKLQLVAYVNQNMPYEQIDRVMTSEEVNDPDCECIFSSAVRLWWLTEKPGRVEGRCFKVSDNKNSCSTRCCQFFSLQIVVATRHYFFTVVYFIVKSVNTLYGIFRSRIYILTSSRHKSSRANSANTSMIATIQFL